MSAIVSREARLPAVLARELRVAFEAKQVAVRAEPEPDCLVTELQTAARTIDALKRDCVAELTTAIDVARTVTTRGDALLSAVVFLREHVAVLDAFLGEHRDEGLETCIELAEDAVLMVDGRVERLARLRVAANEDDDGGAAARLHAFIALRDVKRAVARVLGACERAFRIDAALEA